MQWLAKLINIFILIGTMFVGTVKPLLEKVYDFLRRNNFNLVLQLSALIILVPLSITMLLANHAEKSQIYHFLKLFLLGVLCVILAWLCSNDFRKMFIYRNSVYYFKVISINVVTFLALCISGTMSCLLVSEVILNSKTVTDRGYFIFLASLILFVFTAFYYIKKPIRYIKEYKKRVRNTRTKNDLASKLFTFCNFISAIITIIVGIIPIISKFILLIQGSTRGA